MKFDVSILRGARADADRILEWIADRSPQGAAQWGRAYDYAILKLKRDADQHALAPESGELGKEIRESLFRTRRGRPYRLLYVIVANEARVLRVRGPGQAPLTPEDISE